ncbi:MAG: glycosyltransferase [Bacteroidetes bacterium]|nr:glycosyltransferase [Bacteroidota bacterium]
MKKNKISILVSNDITTDQRMYRICQTLYNCGFEIEIAGRKLQNSSQLNFESYKQIRHNLLFVKGPLFYLELNIRHFLFLLKSKPQAAYSVDADTALSAYFYCKIANSKLIYDSHELFSEVPELENRYLVKNIWKFIEKLIINNSDLRITVSQSIAKYYEKLYNHKFYVIRNVPLKKEKSKSEIHEKYIIYQGALNKGRCIEKLIQAVENIDIKVKIAGDGDLNNNLRKLAKKLKVEEKVEFLGKLNPHSLQLITNNAWLGFNMLENCSLSYYYSLSNKTFDYLQAQIPQLISGFPEYVSLNEEYKFGLIIENNLSTIAKTIELLLSDQKLYEQLKIGAEEASKNLIWENEEYKLTEIVKNLFKNN